MTLVQEMKARIAHLRNTVDALSLRERVLLFAVASVVLATFWHVALMQPLTIRADAARNEIKVIRLRTEESNRLLEQQVSLFGTSDDEQRRQIQVLKERIDELNRHLGEYAAELIDPAEMARVLEDVLQQQGRLKLNHVRNLTAEPLLQDTDTSATALFRHGLEIEFEGSYFACLEYLEDIEALPWRLYWQLIELDVDEYPQNRVRLKVSTLSLDKEWIGA